jgi:FMN-dependent oxidoreductase (nitrilotriacetate monooxygenase family)
MFRAVGAYPTGWRFPGAHHDPQGDADVIRATALEAERAGLDYIFFGDWLATGPDLEFRDPYLAARIEPLSAVGFLAGVTSRIGLIATVNATYSDVYTLARISASVDRLSGGRLGLNIVTGAEPRAAANHGRDAHWDNEQRYDSAEELIDALRLLWDSWGEGALVADQESGVFLDPAKLHRADFPGVHHPVAGPLNVLRPVQGHVPLVHAGTSARSRQLVHSRADLALVGLAGIAGAREATDKLRLEVAAQGREPGDVKIITPVLPILGETLEEAWDIHDVLVSYVPVSPGPHDGREGFPATRSLAALDEVIGFAVGHRGLDSEVSTADAAAFTPRGRGLLDTVAERSGRIPGSGRPVRWRDLLVNHLVPYNVVVGTPVLVADHMQSWYEDGGVDGFNVLTPYLADQFERFTRGVIPELQARGLFRRGYGTSTLRGHLGLTVPGNLFEQKQEESDLRGDHFISAADLAHQLEEESPPVLLDIRFQPGLADPGAEYAAGHLPGAHYVHLPTVLADSGPGSARPANDGALPLPRIAALQESLRQLGICDDSRIVVYDNRKGLSAARAWWVLKWAGLTDVRVLDGGYGYWRSRNLPIATDRPVVVERGTVTLTGGHLPTVSTEQAGQLPAPGVLIDAREVQHFSAGAAGAPAHIPGARNLPSSADVDHHGLLLPSEVLRDRYRAAGIEPGTVVGSYCGAGVLAAHKVLTLATLGISSSLYVGSWSAWSASDVG